MNSVMSTIFAQQNLSDKLLLVLIKVYWHHSFYLLLVCNPCLRMRMMNCSSAIDVILSY